MSEENIVVVAVDGSEAAKTAVRWAANTALKRDVPLRIAACYTMPQFLYAEGMVPPQELLPAVYGCRTSPGRNFLCP